MICQPLESDDGAQHPLPVWIDERLLAETKAVWEPIYERTLTISEAVEILLSVGRLLDAL